MKLCSIIGFIFFPQKCKMEGKYVRHCRHTPEYFIMIKLYVHEENNRMRKLSLFVCAAGLCSVAFYAPADAKFSQPEQL